MVKNWNFLLLLPLIGSGCKQDSIPNATPTDIPEVIKEKVDAFKKQSFFCSDASIVEFRFQNAKVYGFSDGTCTSEPSSGIYDVNGKALCTLGGLSGATTCNGEPFSKATALRTIWKNK